MFNRYIILPPHKAGAYPRPPGNRRQRGTAYAAAGKSPASPQSAITLENCS
jgi:hypothetical protein